MSGVFSVHLVRHAESLWNVQQRYQGQSDSGLTDRGRRQAHALAPALALVVPRPDLVVASDLPRAVATATPYAALVGTPVRTSAGLREAGVGDWAGRSFEDVAAQDPEVVAAIRAGDDPPRGGDETFREVRERTVAELAAYLTAWDDSRDATAVVFTHGGPIRLAVAAAMGVPTPGHHGFASPDNCSVTTIVHRRSQCAELVRYNHVVVGDTAETDGRLS